MSRISIQLHDGSRREITPAGAAAGAHLAAILENHGLPVNTRCGGRGLCRGCEVQLISGRVRRGAEIVQAPAAIRTCQTRADGDITLDIPARARMEHLPQVGESFRIDIPTAHDPLFPPVPGARDTGFAIDLGTTTVVVQLVDLVTGALLGKAGGFNQQIRFGDNVLTRIEAGGDAAGRRGLQQAIAGETLGPLLEQACRRSGRSPARLAGGTIAGNTTMLHLLLGIDPTPLGVAPFTPVFLAGRRVACGDIGLAVAGAEPLDPGTPLHLLPGISGFVGADILAGVLATGMAYEPAPSLLIDVGTNGEMVLQSGGRRFACATAAGPAFEGCGLSCGTRARDGAVGGLRLIGGDSLSVELSTIGNVPPERATGICGSAYIDFLAGGRRSGLLTPSGRFASDVWDRLADDQRLAGEGGRAIRLAGGSGAAAVGVSEVDVALLLQAKAAIGAGMEILLESAGITAAELGRVHLAGGFGMHLDVSHAIAIGLLPGLQPGQIEVSGNSSLAGAVLALLDQTTLEEMEALRADVQVVELNLHPDFEDLYIDHLSLP